MSLRSDYFDYLSYFQATETLFQYASSTGPAIGLRHDIDHCIDMALEMAYWEAENNISASYFILDTPQYNNDPLLFDKCLQIQEFGHEIGIHTNSITKWLATGVDPFDDIKEKIQSYREYGINVHGTSAHGDQACYKHNFINYWVFSGLKPDDVIDRESSRNAEGIYEPDTSKQIKYPNTHELKREDGSVLKLWSGDEKELGLVYEASHLESDLYFTDSGGSWKRSPDPMKEDLRGKRVQVLMHPIHWRAPRKIYFFLSTARSGSKWLSTVLEQASSCTAKHEYTLNHFDSKNTNKVLEEKMTGHKLQELLADENKIERSLDHTRQIVDTQVNDYSEANVYLPLVINQLKNKFPDAHVIHLHRDPIDVIRSIMNRSWYDTPYDSAHPSNLDDNWDKYSPFQKCCSYVRFVNELLIKNCEKRFSFEKMTMDPNYLKESLKNLGVAYYPLLSKNIIKLKINANKRNDFPGYDDWNAVNKNIYDDCLYDIYNGLGYKNNSHGNDEKTKGVSVSLDKLSSYAGSARICWRSIHSKYFIKKYVFKVNSAKDIISKSFLNNISLQDNINTIGLHAINSDEHSFLLVKGGDWRKLKRNAGFSIAQNGYYMINISSVNLSDVKVNVLCLYYDKNRALLHQRSLGILDKGIKEKAFSFASIGNCAYFNIAIYLPKQNIERNIELSQISLKFKKN